MIITGTVPDLCTVIMITGTVPDLCTVITGTVSDMCSQGNNRYCT